jgi:hypothetical protein
MEKNDRLLVRKSTGDMEPFSAEKVANSLKRAGASEELISEIADELDTVLHDGISTSKLYKQVYTLLRKKQTATAARYRLKKAIMDLGPTGYPFEFFVGEIIRRRGFEVEIGQVLEGRCVSHEVDVVATGKGKRYFIECKYYHSQGKYADVKVALYIHSRVNDLVAKQSSLPGTEDFQFGGWIVTNTRFTSDAIAYGECSGLELLSWDYPENGGLKDIAGREKLYPVTALSTLNGKHKKNLIREGIVICQQLHDRPQLLDALEPDPERRKKVLNEVAGLCK